MVKVRAQKNQENEHENNKELGGKSMRVKKALYDAGVASWIQQCGGLEKALQNIENTKYSRTKKQNFDIRKKIESIGNNEPIFYLKHILKDLKIDVITTKNKENRNESKNSN